MSQKEEKKTFFSKFEQCTEVKKLSGKEMMLLKGGNRSYGGCPPPEED